MSPTVYQPPDPYPYSFSNPNKEPYPQTWSGAERFISDAREGGPYPHWQYVKTNPYVHSPILSERIRTGDCDDYAVMMAAYLQDYWGYDTFIVLVHFINDPPNEGHAACFVEEDSGLVTCPIGCTSWPRILLINNGKNYVPVDFHACPGWTWLDQGGTATYWDVNTTNIISGQNIHLEAGVVREWNELVNLTLSLPLDSKGKKALEPIPAVRVTPPSS